MNFYKRYPGDYGRDTSHLSLAEHGAYTLLMDHYYSTEKPIKTDRVSLFRLCRAFSEEEQAATMRVADEFFPVGDDGMRHNARADRQIPVERQAIDAARNNGKKGGRPVVSVVTEAKPSHNPGVMQNITQNITGSEPTSKALPLPLPIEAKSKSSLVQRAARFDEFWSVYPVRKGKAHALKKWKARNLDAIADRIIDDVKARIEGDRQWLDGYVPHGSTYVNGKGWEDAIEAPRHKQAGSTAYVPMPGEK